MVPLILLMLLAINCPSAQADIKLKMTVENPSETEEKTMPVKVYLPKGIKPEDITDKGKFEIVYDFGKSKYYAYQEVTLKPKETLELEIAMKDIWVIPEDEIGVLKDHIAKIISGLRKTQYYDQAKTLSDNINNRLDRILEKEKEGNASVEGRLSDYEANTALLKQAKKDIAVLEDLAIDMGVLGDEEILGRNPDEVTPFRVEETDLKIEDLGVVKFKIEVSNPSTEEKTIPLKYYFPSEVKMEYIVNSGGLDIGYDYKEGIHYVYKDAITLAPEEKREYIVEVKDIWTVPVETIKILKTHTESLMYILGESEYKQTSETLGNRVIATLDSISVAPKDPLTSVERHIGEYRTALAKLDDAKKDIARLEKLVVQVGGSPGLTLSKAGGQGSEESDQATAGKSKGAKAKGKGQGNLARGAQGMEIIGKSIFRGKAPNIATTWKLIYIIVGFLAVSSLLFIMIQFQQRRTVMFDALTGAFRREYIFDRLKEEFLITQKANNKCSLLLADIDKFKSINDTYGHAVGDIVIKEFMATLRQGIRNADLIGRMGGDEFLVILAYADKDRARMIAEKIARLVAEHVVKLKDKTLNMSVSIGVATYPDDSLAVKELIDKADKAMYKAKAAGGNGVAV